MTDKKISFGFTKLKKPSLLPGVSVSKKEDIELIQCLEEQTIKIIGEQVKFKEKLVIPLQNNTKTSAALAALKTLRETLDGTLDNTITEPTNSAITIKGEASTLEQRAALEILNGLKEPNNVEQTNHKLSVPIKADDLPLNGASESNLDDYDRIPVNQYGLAMLRGMGWSEPSECEKKANIQLEPALRPKGMGLGADKMVKSKPLLVAPAKDEVLTIRKNASVRILLGKHKDMYGQIESLDDHAGRLLIKLAIGNTQEWFSEFMVQPVSKQEYTQYAKVINSAKYEDYKKRQQDKNSIKIADNEKMHGHTSQRNISPKTSYNYNSNDSDDNYYHNKRDISKKNQSIDNRDRLDHRDHVRNNKESVRHNQSSDSEEEKLRIQHNSRQCYISENSDNSSDQEKRRSTHKKSGHKSRRHRSRSRSYSRQKMVDYDRIKDNNDAENKHHYKKKTKKSKRQRSRSKTRR